MCHPARSVLRPDPTTPTEPVDLVEDPGKVDPTLRRQSTIGNAGELDMPDLRPDPAQAVQEISFLHLDVIAIEHDLQIMQSSSVNELGCLGYRRSQITGAVGAIQP
jgi:hypothetical protein